MQLGPQEYVFFIGHLCPALGMQVAKTVLPMYPRGKCDDLRIILSICRLAVPSWDSIAANHGGSCMDTALMDGAGSD